MKILAPVILAIFFYLGALACRDEASRLYVGQDRKEVVAILGEPQWVEEDAFRGPLAPTGKICMARNIKSCFVYDRMFSKSLLVYFDKSEKLSCVELSIVFHAVTRP